MNRQDQAALQERAAERSRRAMRAASLLSIERIRGQINRRLLVEQLSLGYATRAIRLVDDAIAAEPFYPLQSALNDALVSAGRLIGDELATTFVRKRAPWGFRAFETPVVQAAQSWIGGVVNYL